MCKLVYCATPSRMAKKKKKIMDFVTSKGYAPFHPFQAFEYKRFEGGPVGRKKTIEFCCRAIDICDEFWMFGISEGTLEELSHVLKQNLVSRNPKPIRLFLNEFDRNWKAKYRELRDRFGDPLSKVVGEGIK